MQQLAIKLAALVLPYIAKFATSTLIPKLKQFALKHSYTKADTEVNKLMSSYAVLYEKWKNETDPAKKAMKLEGLKIGGEIIKATAEKYKQYADAIILPE